MILGVGWAKEKEYKNIAYNKYMIAYIMFFDIINWSYFIFTVLHLFNKVIIFTYNTFGLMDLSYVNQRKLDFSGFAEV